MAQFAIPVRRFALTSLIHDAVFIVLHVPRQYKVPTFTEDTLLLRRWCFAFKLTHNESGAVYLRLDVFIIVSSIDEGVFDEV